MKKFVLVFITLILAFPALSRKNFTETQKGDFYFYWGYNRAAFTTSDVRFTGPGYDFTLNDVQGYDRPTDFDADVYFNPASFTIPQYIYRIGYFFTANWSISLGMDHMKYVMPQNVAYTIEGEINQAGNPFNGVYSYGSKMVMDPAFLTFEHTDGLNYANFSADYDFSLYVNPKGTIGISAFGGGGLGMMIPKSNVQLMSGERHDAFHVAGYGLHADLGVNITFWRHLFLRTQAKGGFIHMPNILTRPNNASDRASQHFWFGMWDFALGWQWHF